MLWEDRFTVWLRANWETDVRKLKKYAPAGHLGAAPVGWEIQIGHSKFVYRIAAQKQHILIIVLFERLESCSGLRSPFTDFVKFLSLVKRAEVGVTGIAGHIDALDAAQGPNLESERIAAFYKKHLAAFSIGVRNDLEWVAGDLTKFEPPVSAGKPDAV